MIKLLEYQRLNKFYFFFLTAFLICLTDFTFLRNMNVLAEFPPTLNITPERVSDREIYEQSQLLTVRVIKTDSAGSGVIINRQGNTYSVLTNWHVVNSSQPIILTADDQQHLLIQPPQQLKDVDLALLQFVSEGEYPVANIEVATPQVGEKVYAAGFPLTIGDNKNSLDLGNQAFLLTEGKISLVPTKSLPLGYQLGYTNETEIGMSGSPIFNAQGMLVAIHGRGKHRDPGFGVYIFADGTEPTTEQLTQMIQSSWGIPISTYLKSSN